MTTIPASAAQLTLTTDDGVAATFGSLWAEQPAVVVFLRHFG